MQPHRTHRPPVLNPIRPGKFQAPSIRTVSAWAVISARISSLLQSPALGQELLPGGHLSQKRDPVWREPIPLNRCDLFAILPAVRSTGSLLGLIELLDLGDFPGEPEGRVDLVFGIARGLVDEDRPERIVAGEFERAGTHCEVVE